MPNPQYLFAVTTQCVCVHSPQNRNPKKPLENKKKIEKIIIAIVSASNILQKKKERWSVSPGMIVVEARTTFFLRETINNDCGQCRIRDNTLNIFTILPLLNKLFRYLLVYSYQTGWSKDLRLQMDVIVLNGPGLLQDCLNLKQVKILK